MQNGKSQNNDFILLDYNNSCVHHFNAEAGKGGVITLCSVVNLPASL